MRRKFTKPITYSMNSQLRSALAVFDDLGFNNAWEASNAILEYDDFVERWDIQTTADFDKTQTHLDYLIKWRKETLTQNSLL